MIAKQWQISLLLVFITMMTACTSGSETDAIAGTVTTPHMATISIMVTPTATVLVVPAAQETKPSSVTATLSPSATPTSTPNPSIQTLSAPAIALAADPRDQKMAYALLITGELYRTADTGQTWQRLPLLVPVQPYTPIKPENPNWIIAFPPQQDIVVATSTPAYLFVRVDQVLYRSDDQGVTWQRLQDEVGAWTVETSRADSIYTWRFSMTQNHGLYHSTDYGQTWSHVYTDVFPPFYQLQGYRPENMPKNDGITALLVANNYLYAGTDFGIFRSSDGGRTWQEFNTGLPPTQRVYRWTPILTGGGADTYALTNFSADGVDEQSILVQLQNGQISPVDDTWAIVGQEALAHYASFEARHGFSKIETLISDPIQKQRLYLGTEEGLLISEDAGQTWQLLHLPQVSAVFRIAVAPGQPTQLYLGTDQGLVTTTLAQ